MDRNKESLEIDVKRILFALWSRAWIIMLAGVVLAATAFSYAFFLVTPTYASSVKIYVNNNYSGSEGISSSQLVAAQDLADTYMVILESRSVLDKVAQQTGLGYSVKDLGEMITAQSINETEVFEVEVISADYRHSAAIADAVASVLPDRIAEVVEGSSVRVVDYAEENPNPVGPSYQMYIILGAAIGVVLAAAIIVLADVMDTTITSEEYLTHTYQQYPLLAVIPGANGSKSGYYKGYRGYYQAEPRKRPDVTGGGAE